MTPSQVQNFGVRRTRKRPNFVRKFAKALGVVAAIIGFSLALGVVGYHSIAGFSWIDSLLNASMILGGMGPVGELPGDGAKVFASIFALYSGLVLISVTGLLLSPMFHNVLHVFHIDEDDAA